MKLFALILISLLISACGTRYEGARSPGLVGGESSDCDSYLDGMCTMEYSPYTCTAIYNGKEIESSEANKCSTMMHFRYEACQMGFSDSQINKMKPTCSQAEVAY